MLAANPTLCCACVRACGQVRIAANYQLVIMGWGEDQFTGQQGGEEDKIATILAAIKASLAPAYCSSTRRARPAPPTHLGTARRPVLCAPSRSVPPHRPRTAGPRRRRSAVCLAHR